VLLDLLMQVNVLFKMTPMVYQSLKVLFEAQLGAMTPTDAFQGLAWVLTRPQVVRRHEGYLWL